MLFAQSALLSLFATHAVVHASADGDHHPHGEHSFRNSEVVQGKIFDRIVQIWLENTDFDAAFADPSLQALAKQGLTLTNYFAVTHPSEPNYVASVGGEYFGMNNDNLNNVPANVSSVVDLLEDKEISWAEYQEDMPSTGFQGFDFRNPQTGANDYVRKHNPLIIFQSVTEKPNRLANIKNFTLFQEDLAANKLPQWIFITPNMTNDGHDTNVTFTGKWAKDFIEPLLQNPNFNDDRTLVVLTFDENEAGSQPNRVFTILLGGAVPKELIGKTDDNFYDHYSTIATVEANWNLHTLGRWDVGANVFGFVGEQTGDRLQKPQNMSSIELNLSYPGIFNTKKWAKQPVPNTRLVVNGRTVLPAIVDAWDSQVNCTGYFGQLVPPSGLTPPPIPTGC
ncbi:putative phosphoesterase family protein [Lyophyllum shimeji]|uniref:Phosphoesterase family protein n=1 Tax=Lyophyllum shimeji TaxID=47721 RepID=A0A9P3UU82_LYOSH|nr:putative phosphoesterase family protein [Lyophyllum shimeji]